jgi:hypothetical protein
MTDCGKFQHCHFLENKQLNPKTRRKKNANAIIIEEEIANHIANHISYKFFMKNCKLSQNT